LTWHPPVIISDIIISYDYWGFNMGLQYHGRRRITAEDAEVTEGEGGKRETED
jgi:hypothetical protein